MTVISVIISCALWFADKVAMVAFRQPEYIAVVRTSGLRMFPSLQLLQLMSEVVAMEAPRFWPWHCRLYTAFGRQPLNWQLLSAHMEGRRLHSVTSCRWSARIVGG